ncbi:MAG: hypothetical protein OXH65_12795, partial [Paracoccaceae bacterium]|nr:hypothetical protein [Paracoccaceae bacterium]
HGGKDPSIPLVNLFEGRIKCWWKKLAGITDGTVITALHSPISSTLILRALENGSLCMNSLASARLDGI